MSQSAQPMLGARRDQMFPTMARADIDRLHRFGESKFYKTADIVVDSVGGDILSEALEVLAPDGSLTTLGYSASRKTTIDVTNLIWKGASIKSFLLFSQPVSARAEAWTTITELLKSRRVEPIIAKTFPPA